IFIIVLLPLTVYTVYQLNNLSDNEKFLENVYNEQLNTIIFSVNQYVDDLLQSWSGRIINIYNNDNSDIQNEFTNFCSSNPSISLIIISDTLFSNDIKFYSKAGQNNSENAITRMQNILKSNSEKIENLKKFKNLGYNRIETLSNKLDDTPLLSFLINEEHNIRVAILVINMDEFINKNLVSKINSISSNDLIVSVFHNEELITNSSNSEIQFSDLIEHKNIWNFPNYYLGVSTTSATIQDIVKERSFINMIILALLNLIIISGVIFLFISINREIKLSQLKSDFVSNVSHEIRTPLSLIGMFAETLELDRVTTEEKKDEYYRIIRKETERLTRIVNSILNFSKMESNSKKYKFEKNNLNNIIDEVLVTYQHELNNGKNICLIKKLDNLPDIEIDKEAIMEATMNLIDNAIKYCHDKCEIEISTGINDNFAYIEVKDNGIGISKENQKKIFEKFFRVTSGNVHNTKGSGLGLSLVKHIVEAHNGIISVESKLGNGSKFRLNFPINNLT
ncbi:MAG: HAMP domain-containing histidine kinase, partial [Ignavibacteriae bacterium]|nr:HAMP domain-containing histidine kinase [Ignavibacteriota bacterium]